jgi:DNA-directed RNA polymerase specialized sigma24 family protein
VLRYFEDLPEAEVATLLRCPVGTVRSTAYRSLAKLRALVPELAPEGPAKQVELLSYASKGIQA